MICAICEREILSDFGEEDWRGANPVDPTICFGCWVSWVEVEKFIIRSGRRQPFTLRVYELMRELLSGLSKDYE